MMWLGPTAAAVWGSNRVVSLSSPRKLADAGGESVEGNRADASSVTLAVSAELAIRSGLEAVVAVGFVSGAAVRCFLSNRRSGPDLDLLTGSLCERPGRRRLRLSGDWRISLLGGMYSWSSAA